MIYSKKHAEILDMDMVSLQAGQRTQEISLSLMNGATTLIR